MEHLGVKTRLVRPPYGTVTPKISEYLAQTGRELALWSISAKDWEGPDAQSVAKRLTDQLTRDDITAVLHDYLDFNPDVIDLAIPVIKQRGYTFKTYQPYEVRMPRRCTIKKGKAL